MNIYEYIEFASLEYYIGKMARCADSLPPLVRMHHRVFSMVPRMCRVSMALPFLDMKPWVGSWWVKLEYVCGQVRWHGASEIDKCRWISRLADRIVILQYWACFCPDGVMKYDEAILCPATCGAPSERSEVQQARHVAEVQAIPMALRWFHWHREQSQRKGTADCLPQSAASEPSMCFVV